MDWEEVLQSPAGVAEAIHFHAQGDSCIPTTHVSPNPQETVPEVSTDMYSQQSRQSQPLLVHTCIGVYGQFFSTILTVSTIVGAHMHWCQMAFFLDSLDLS